AGRGTSPWPAWGGSSPERARSYPPPTGSTAARSARRSAGRRPPGPRGRGRRGSRPCGRNAGRRTGCWAGGGSLAPPRGGPRWRSGVRLGPLFVQLPGEVFDVTPVDVDHGALEVALEVVPRAARVEVLAVLRVELHGDVRVV